MRKREGTQPLSYKDRRFGGGDFAAWRGLVSRNAGAMAEIEDGPLRKAGPTRARQLQIFGERRGVDIMEG